MDECAIDSGSEHECQSCELYGNEKRKCRLVANHFKHLNSVADSAGVTVGFSA